MRRRNPILLVFLVGTIFLGISCQASGPAGLQSDSSQLQRLRKVAGTTLEKGMDNKSKADLVALATEFDAQPDLSTELLLVRLHELQTDLRSSSKQGRATYRVRQQEQMLILFMIPDLYSKAAVANRAKLLDAIQHSFLPVPQTNDEVMPNFWALLAIGKDSVPALISLSSHDNKRVRCQAQEALIGVTKGRGAPPLDCEDPIVKQEGQIRKWSEWWSQNANAVSFPVVKTPIQEYRLGR